MGDFFRIVRGRWCGRGEAGGGLGGRWGLVGVGPPSVGVGGGGKGRGVGAGVRITRVEGEEGGLGMGAGVKEGPQGVGPAVTGLARTRGGGKVLRCAALMIRARACFNAFSSVLPSAYKAALLPSHLF